MRGPAGPRSEERKGRHSLKGGRLKPNTRIFYEKKCLMISYVLHHWEYSLGGRGTSFIEYMICGKLYIH